MQKEWLSPKEVSQEFGFLVDTLAHWRMKDKKLAYSKIGKFVKYRRSDVNDFLEKNRVEIVI